MASNEPVHAGAGVAMTALASEMTEVSRVVDGLVATLTNLNTAADKAAMAANRPHTSGLAGHAMALGGGGAGGNYYPASPNIVLGAGTGGANPGFAPNHLGFLEATSISCPLGHTAGEDTIEYIDGVIVGRCVDCGDRIQIQKISGGMSLLRIKHLLGVVMAIDDETAQLEDFSLSDVLAEYTSIKDLLEAEEFAIRQARKLFDLADQLLTQKVSGVEQSDTEL